MTELNIPDVTDDDRRLARKWAKTIAAANRVAYTDPARAAALVILHDLPDPPPPTMADMTLDEQYECRWMQCDAGPYGRRGLIVKVKYWSVYVVDKETGAYSDYTPDLVTARPDLPRMDWEGTDQEIEEASTVKVGDVIESADDPRIDALPVGTIMLDSVGEAVTKRGEAWTGRGYVPIESQGDEFGPWTVLHIPKKADQ